MRRTAHNLQKAQVAIEYILLLAIVAIIVIIGLQKYLLRAHQASEVYFNRVGTGILGKPNPCGDGVCNWEFEGVENCCVDCPQDDPACK